jgi:hypothetical protein
MTPFLIFRPASILPLALSGVLCLFFGVLPAADAAAEPAYNLSAFFIRELEVNVPIQSSESFIVIERPSPGDNQWYRLPYTVELSGNLPKGLRLHQKGKQFGDLAGFEGTPSEAGVFTVRLRATMADGAATRETPHTIVIKDPRGKTCSPNFYNAGELVENEPVANAGLFLTSEYQVVRGAATLDAKGLPPGLKFLPARDGVYALSGTPTTSGTYKVSVAFKWADGASAASTELSLQVHPKESNSTYRLVAQNVNSTALRQNLKCQANSFNHPFFNVENKSGGRYEGAFSLESRGLPQGLSTEFSAFLHMVFIKGTPLEAGTFPVSMRAVLEDGSRSPEVSFLLTVRPATPLESFAGTYDALVDRSPSFNDNNGGRLVVTLARGGAISGYLQHKFSRYAFSSAHAKVDPSTAEITITPPSSGVTFTGQFFIDNSYASPGSGEAYSLTGTLTNASGAFASATGSRYTPSTKAAPSQFSGELPVNLTFISSQAKRVDQPGGPGFCSYRISGTGLVTATVWAADGSAPASTAGYVSESKDFGARFPLYFIIPNSSGRSTLTSHVFISAKGDSAGSVDWFQTASKSGGSFPDGINLINYDGVIGSRFAPAPDGLNLLGLEEGLLNATLELSGADLAADVDIPITVTDKTITPTGPASPAKATVPATVKPLSVPFTKTATPSLQVSNTKINYDKKTGILIGQLQLNDPKTGLSRTLYFRGVRNPDGSGALGHFTVPSRANSKKIAAGELEISPSGTKPATGKTPVAEKGSSK